MLMKKKAHTKTTPVYAVKKSKSLNYVFFCVYQAFSKKGTLFKGDIFHGGTLFKEIRMSSLSHRDHGDIIWQHTQYKFVTLPSSFVLE